MCNSHNILTFALVAREVFDLIFQL